MLNGNDPLVLFHFGKKVPTGIGLEFDIPIVATIENLIEAPPIPVYLSESFFGLIIDSESKNVDIATEVETLTNGETPKTNQKGASSSVTINLVGNKNSISLILLSAFIDLAFDKTSSQEYAITYMHGAVTIFRGLLKSYSVDQADGSDKLNVKIELTRGDSQPVKPAGVPAVPAVTGKIL